MSSKQRKKEFIREIGQCDEIETVEKEKEGVWTVTTQTETKRIWLHYSKSFDFWGVNVNKRDRLSEKEPLIHVFLGPKSENRYVVSDDDLDSGRFFLSQQTDKNGDPKAWKVNARDYPQNENTLKAEYTSLDPITK